MQFNFDQVSVAQGYLTAGRTRALAVVAPQRVKWLPNAPILEEQGIEGIEDQTFTGLLAPAGTQPAVVAIIDNAVRQALAEPAVVARIQSTGANAR